MNESVRESLNKTVLRYAKQIEDLRAENVSLRTELARNHCMPPNYGCPGCGAPCEAVCDEACPERIARVKANPHVMTFDAVISGSYDLVGELPPRGIGTWKVGDVIRGILHDFILLEVWQERTPDGHGPKWMCKARQVDKLIGPPKLVAAVKASDPEDDDDDTDTPVYTPDSVAIDRHMPPEDGCPTCGAKIFWMPGDGTQVCANHHTTNAPPMKLDKDACTCPSLLAGHEPGCPLGGRTCSTT